MSDRKIIEDILKDIQTFRKQMPLSPKPPYDQVYQMVDYGLYLISLNAKAIMEKIEKEP